MIRNEKGQSLVEMALVIPIFLLLLVGIIDISRILYSYTSMHFITQETVRLGGLGYSDAEMIQFAKNQVEFGDPSQLNVKINPVQGSRPSGTYVTVTLQYPMNLSTPLLSSILPDPVMVSTNSTIRVE
ncbi:MAG TPA: TadE/TadG family type IV pilus assembly protein [Chondromyces sp.]|nr:TadE/TadG family type IV pilus assembly protein [Chondromyces sp.]